MIKNYFKIAWRNLQRNKLYSLINITGLSVGIAGCVIIYLYVQHELSYDRFNKNARNIYRLTEVLHLPKEDRRQAPTSPRMAGDMRRNFPAVINTVRINPSSRTLSYKEKKLFDTRIMYADSSFFDIFSYEIVSGNPKKMLASPYSVVLTESAAKKYFGSEEAQGKTMQFSDSINMSVTGIIKDFPATSHLQFDCILSRNTIDDMNRNNPGFAQETKESWFNNSLYTYLLLDEGADAREVERQINKFVHKEMAEIRKNSGMYYDFNLQPLTDIHLKSDYAAELTPNNNSNSMYVYIFSGAAILILLIACSNFINLSTARSLNRSKEIGLRKVIGAGRKQLITQFLGESFLFTLISTLLSLLLVFLVLPFFNAFSGTALSMNCFANPSLLLVYLSIVVVAGLGAGVYPAFLMSSFAPVASLKGVIRHGWQDIVMRKGLVVFQFSIAVMLIIGTSVVLDQLRYMQNKKIGMNKEQVLQIQLKPAEMKKKDVLLKEFRGLANVESVSMSSFSFKDGISNITLRPEGASENEITSQSVISVDEDFLKTFQIELAAGRDFSKAHTTDPDQAFIVNETAVKVFGWKTPAQAIGKGIDWGLGKKGKVIGVVKDFNFKTLQQGIDPIIIHILPDWYRFVSIRVKSKDLPQTLTAIENIWSGNIPDKPFSYSFLDEDFAAFYRGEERMQSVLSIFTVLSVFVACLGLFGLAAFSIKQRFREIGVRKVLGADVKNIVALLSKDFLKLVLLSILIAVPVAWYGIYKWLSEFAFHVSISWPVFAFSGVAAIVVALVTVSGQAMRAALANPVKSLRTE